MGLVLWRRNCTEKNIIIIIIINPLTARVVGAPQMILRTIFSIFPSWTYWTPGLSRKEHISIIIIIVAVVVIIIIIIIITKLFRQFL